jgi:hypothetical protein
VSCGEKTLLPKKNSQIVLLTDSSSCLVGSLQDATGEAERMLDDIIGSTERKLLSKKPRRTSTRKPTTTKSGIYVDELMIDEFDLMDED